MEGKIYSRITAKGEQSLYLKAYGKEYYLFSQNYRKSVRNYYSTPVCLDRALDFTLGTGAAVRKTMEKLRIYIPYVEREYGLCVLDKTRKMKRQHPNKTGRRICGYDAYEVA